MIDGPYEGKLGRRKIGIDTVTSRLRMREWRKEQEIRKGYDR